MKKLLMGLCIVALLLTAGCSGDTQPQSTPSGDENNTSIVTDPDTPDNDDATDDDWDVELDENAPEHITLDSIRDVTAVPMYYTFTVDQKDTDYIIGEVNFPSQLYVEETMELHSKGKVDTNEDDLMVKDYFQDDQKQYVYVEAKGTLPATRPATTHALSVELGFMKEPYTLEGLTEANEGWTVTETTVDGVAAFVVRPDTEENEVGLASTSIYVNAGADDYAYGTVYFTMEIHYQGGLADYSEVDFNEISSALLELITVNFRPVNGW